MIFGIQLNHSGEDGDFRKGKNKVGIQCLLYSYKSKIIYGTTGSTLGQSNVFDEKFVK